MEWHDLDVDTFVRFAKYAYSRDYAEAEPEWAEDDEAKQGADAAAAAGAQRPGSRSSETQVIDLTNQTDGNSDGSDDSEDEEGDRDDEDDDDTSEEESSEGGDQDEDDETSSDSDSNFDNNDPNAVARPHHCLPPTSCQELRNLPFSITSYTERWELYLNNMLFWEATSASASASSSSTTTITTTTARGPPPSKRRRLLASHPSDWRSTSTAKLKHAAMRRFLALDTTNITTSTTTAAAAAAITADRSADTYTPRPNHSPRESFSPVFLSHARLYALAEKYGVEPLKALTLRRLHAALAGFRIYPERLDDLADLVPAVYYSTVDGDPARRMLVLFFACIAEHVKECLAFRAVMRCVGEFADDLFREMTGRLL